MKFCTNIRKIKEYHEKELILKQNFISTFYCKSKRNIQSKHNNNNKIL